MSDEVSEFDRIAESRRILNQLARGIHPVDGTVLMEEGCWTDPSVIRALLLAADCLERAGSASHLPKRKGNSKDADRAGKSWLPDEDNELRFAFEEQNSLSAMAAQHQRSEGGIIARLVRLGVVTDRDEARKIFAQRKNVTE